jgi:hypothetical protein
VVCIVSVVATTELKEAIQRMRGKATALAAALGVATVLSVAACGSGNGPNGGVVSGTSNTPMLLAFAHCMRAHSVPDFPDPGGARRSGSETSILGITLPATIDISSPAFKTAMSACLKLATPGAPQAGVTEAQRQAAVRYSECIRAHGVPNYPDPVFRNGRIGIRPGDANPNSPAFLAAEKACGNP